MAKEKLPAERKGLTHQQMRAAQLWVDGIDVDDTPVRTKREIAQRCGMSEQALYALFNKREFLDEIDKRLTDMKARSGRELLSEVPKAIKRLVDIMENGSDREAFQAAAKILSIAGFSDHKTIDVNINDATGVVRGGFGRNLPDGFGEGAFVEADYEPIDDDTDDEDMYDGDV